MTQDQVVCRRALSQPSQSRQAAHRCSHADFVVQARPKLSIRCQPPNREQPRLRGLIDQLVLSETGCLAPRGQRKRTTEWRNAERCACEQDDRCLTMNASSLKGRAAFERSNRFDDLLDLPRIVPTNGERRMAAPNSQHEPVENESSKPLREPSTPDNCLSKETDRTKAVQITVPGSSD